MEESLDEIEFKIQSLTKYGHDVLMQGSSMEAAESFLSAYQYSKQLHNNLIIRGCCFNLGACYIAGGQPSLGLKYLEKAIPPNGVEDTVENFADLWYNIGVARHAFGDIENAIVAYEKSQTAYNKLNWNKLEGECLSKLAVCYHLKDRLQESRDMYKKAQIIYKELNDTNNQALCLVSETNVLTQMGDIDGCAKVLDHLLDVCQEIKDHHLQAKIYHDVGLLYISENLYESASECFEQALKCMNLSNTEDEQLKATILQNIGAVCNYMKVYEKAIEYHRKAVDVYGKLNDRHSQTQVFSNLAFAYSQTNEFSESIIAFQHSIQAAKDCSDKESQLLATEGLAAVWFRLKDYKKSVDSYKNALSIPYAKNTISNKHTDRIVDKLADAMRYQLQSESSIIKTVTVTDEIDSKDQRKGRPRFSRDNRQSLIAKGLEDESTCDDSSDEVSGSEEITETEEESSIDSKSELARTPSSRSKKLSVREELGMNFNMKTTLETKNGVEPLLDYDDEIPRADKEYYLATVSQKQANQQEMPEKVSSKMCLIM